MQITIDLPDSLAAYLESQIDIGLYPTPSHYIRSLIEADRQYLETKVLEGINSGSATPMTEEDWDYIRATVRQNLTLKCRQAGTMKGMFNMADDFDAPLKNMKDYM
jgi:antitoxin ParD1/3/4